MTTPPPDARSTRAETAVPPMWVAVARGNLYLSRELCEACLRGVEAVALLEREEQLLIVPLTPSSGGGLLLKIRNARGDRVVHAQEFFRDKGYLEDFQERLYPARWDAQRAALVMVALRRSGDDMQT